MKIGAFTQNWETAPTATRLEGLTSVLSFIPDTSSLYKEVRKSCDLGIKYLLHTQIKEGDNKGAFTQNISTYNSIEEKRKNRWANTEIRIDYVQHALSALIQYSNLTSVAGES